MYGIGRTPDRNSMSEGAHRKAMGPREAPLASRVAGSALRKFEKLHADPAFAAVGHAEG